MAKLDQPFNPKVVPKVVGQGNMDVALRYAQAGQRVFPCSPEPDPKRSSAPQKTPLVKWKDEATTDLAAIVEWWTRWPNALVGLVMEDLFAIDCDRHGGPDGVAAFAQLIEQNGAWPANVPNAATVSDGLHYYFAQPAGTPVTNRRGRLPDGVDVRGFGGFVIAPGTQWRGSGWRDGDVSLVDAIECGAVPAAPAWLLDLIQGMPIDNRVDDRPPLSERARAPAQIYADDDEVEFRYIEDATSFIRSDNYDTWITVGAALHDKFGQRGRALWDAWSMTSSKYDKPAQDKAWQSFGRPYAGARATVGTIIAMARQGGFGAAKHDYAPTVDVPPAWTERVIANLTKNQPDRENAMQPAPAPQRIALKTVNAASLATLPVPQRKWFVHNMIPAQNVTLVYGDGSTGKSLLCLQLAAVAATPADGPYMKPLWIGEQPAYGKTVFVSAEDEIDEVHRRLADIEPDMSRLSNLEIVPLAGEEAILAAPDGRDGLLKETPLFRALQDVVAQHKPVLLVLDTLADLFGGDEIKKVHARQFISMLRGLAFDHDCTVVLLAHPSQHGMSSGDGTSGNVAWNNSVRSRLYFERVLTNVGGRIIEEDKDLRCLSVKKSNRGPRPASIYVRWQDGQFVREERAEANSDEEHAEIDELFMSLLKQFAKEKRDVSPKPSNTYAPTIFATHPRAEKVNKRQLADAMNRLLEAGRVKVEEHGPPSKRRSFLVVADGSAKASGAADEAPDEGKRTMQEDEE